MSVDESTATDSLQAYYEYLRDTADVARTLTERCIRLEEANLASGANLVRVQLQTMLDGIIDQQQASMPLPSLDS